MAGAGSGKTRVITRRIAWRVYRGVPFSSILAITFTNKAAAEMRRRVEEMVGEGRVFISTFHSMCARFLRISGAAVDIDPRFTICDAEDQKSMIKEILKNLNLDPTHFHPASVLSAISLMKNGMVSANDAAARASSWFDRAVARVYEAYDEYLAVNGALDFDDLLSRTLEMFQTREDVLEEYRERYRNILIDEYQDTNQVQYLIAKALAGENGNICATGDPDQSIYRWRGADIRNIVGFERDFPGARVVKLEQNYRSTGHIIKAASGVISHNVVRKKRDLWTRAPDGEKLTVLLSENESEEADWIVREVRDHHARGTPYGKMAVFYRVNALSRAFERSLRIFNIPYVIVGGVEFYQRKEIKDLLAYLKLVHNRRDAISLYRVLNTPPRGIGLTTLKRLKKDALEQGRPPIDVLKGYGPSSGLSSRPLKGVKDFLALLESWNNIAGGLVQVLLRTIIEDTGFLDYLRKFNDGSADERLDNVSELIYAVEEYEDNNIEPGLGGYLEETVLIQDIDAWDDRSESVTLMTLHSAKGLEFDVVFMAGVEEGLIPHSRSMDDDEEFEEERRLMYVGITRAREKLYLSHSVMRSRFGERVRSLPSRFLNEIPREVLETPAAVDRGRAGAFAHRPDGGRALFDDNGTGSVLEYDGDVPPVFECGDQVEHPYFGLGEVIQVTGSGPSARLKVQFVQAGEKLLQVEYAKLRKVL